MYLTDDGLIVPTESDVVTLTPVKVLKAVSNLSTTPIPIVIALSVMVLNEPNCLDIESDIDTDSGIVLYVANNLLTVSLTVSIPPATVSNTTGSNRLFVPSNRVCFSTMSAEYLLAVSNTAES